jgi:hypothetical protein
MGFLPYDLANLFCSEMMHIIAFFRGEGGLWSNEKKSALENKYIYT